LLEVSFPHAVNAGVEDIGYHHILLPHVLLAFSWNSGPHRPPLTGLAVLGSSLPARDRSRCRAVTAAIIFAARLRGLSIDAQAITTVEGCVICPASVGGYFAWATRAAVPGGGSFRQQGKNSFIFVGQRLRNNLEILWLVFLSFWGNFVTKGHRVQVDLIVKIEMQQVIRNGSSILEMTCIAVDAHCADIRGRLILKQLPQKVEAGTGLGPVPYLTVDG